MNRDHLPQCECSYCSGKRKYQPYHPYQRMNKRQAKEKRQEQCPSKCNRPDINPTTSTSDVKRETSMAGLGNMNYGRNNHASRRSIAGRNVNYGRNNHAMAGRNKNYGRNNHALRRSMAGRNMNYGRIKDALAQNVQLDMNIAKTSAKEVPINKTVKPGVVPNQPKTCHFTLNLKAPPEQEIKKSPTGSPCDSNKKPAERALETSMASLGNSIFGPIKDLAQNLQLHMNIARTSAKDVPENKTVKPDPDMVPDQPKTCHFILKAPHEIKQD